MSAEPYTATWIAPGDPAAVESLVLTSLTSLGGRRAETRGDVLFDGGYVLHMEAHVVPNAEKHPGMTAHVSLAPGPSEITTRVTVAFVARHERDATSDRFRNRCLELVTSVKDVTGSVPEAS